MWSMGSHFSNFHAQYTLREEEKGKERGGNSSVNVDQRNYIALLQLLSKADLAGVSV